MKTPSCVFSATLPAATMRDARSYTRSTPLVPVEVLSAVSSPGSTSAGDLSARSGEAAEDEAVAVAGCSVSSVSSTHSDSECRPQYPQVQQQWMSQSGGRLTGIFVEHSRTRGEVASTPCHFLARVMSRQHVVDCESLIHISPLSSTKDPRPQTIAICNLESAVRPHLNATLYSVQTCMIKC